ncbi:MAG: response regulator transcription factor [Phaeodactylibacter sp.]|nr:response regulator transcription factor [Phaeodactylibacter sp.]MCB9048061.1 response regulator transcription factor [Lewinellaceae bacterium]
MKILIIEDEPALASSIEQYLEQEGYLCELAYTFAEAMIKSGAHEYDCILVDLTLPGGNGLDVIRALKKEHSKAGIIIISAKHSLDDKIKGLEIGSDDYLAKPFHLSELNARIKALLRRKQFNGEQRIDFHEISVWMDKQEVKVNQEFLNLTRSEYRLLLYFLANRNRVLSKESIAEHLAGDQADMLDSLDFVYSHIKNLRKKLVQAGAEDYIQAVYGMGYKFSGQ